MSLRVLRLLCYFEPKLFGLSSTMVVVLQWLRVRQVQRIRRSALPDVMALGSCCGSCWRPDGFS
jgi:hypothetical protein